MKKLFTILQVIFLFLSCNKNSEDYKYLSFIIAGQKNGIGIKYTDIVPDDDSLGFYPSPLVQTKYLDLNNDNVNDFELISTISDPMMMSMGVRQLEIKPLGNNFVCITRYGNNWAEPFKYNDTISEQNNWSDSNALLYYFYWRLGDHGTPPVINDSVSIKGYWFESDSIYIGVKISKNSVPVFGWIDMKENMLKQYAVTIPY
jgi:hypothetical protein